MKFLVIAFCRTEEKPKNFETLFFTFFFFYLFSLAARKTTLYVVDFCITVDSVKSLKGKKKRKKRNPILLKLVLALWVTQMKNMKTKEKTN